MFRRGFFFVREWLREKLFLNYLVTGGAGFIGSHIVEALVAKGDGFVRVIDNLRSGRMRNLDGMNVDFVEGSITDEHLLDRALADVDAVFHLAAMVSVPETMKYPRECMEINTLGTLQLLVAAKRHGARRIVFSSTSAVYGDDPIQPKCESMDPQPLSPYAVSKLNSEMAVQLLGEQSNFRAAALRYFNVYGPRQDPNSAYAAAIPIFVARALRNEDIVIFGDGEQTRDFVFVKDVVQANLLAIEKGEGIYNVGAGSTVTINELARQIVSKTNSKSEILHTDPRPGDVKHSSADISRIKEIGFEPDAERDEALARTVGYFEAISG
jgi:UDP-glucose 4-epimerase